MAAAFEATCSEQEALFYVAVIVMTLAIVSFFGRVHSRLIQTVLCLNVILKKYACLTIRQIRALPTRA